MPSFQKHCKQIHINLMFHVKEKKVGGHISNIWDLAWIKLFLAKIGVNLFLTFMINKLNMPNV